jgi:hypothetical protein
MTARGIVAWHGLHASEAVRLLGIDVENGLSESEAVARLARFGPKKVTRRSGPPGVEAPPAPVPRAARLHLAGCRGRHRVFIAKLTDIQQNAGQLLAALQASEHDAFASHLYRSRQEYRLVCQRAGKGGKPIERCVISSFKVAESMEFKGDFRQWEDPLRTGD